MLEFADGREINDALRQSIINKCQVQKRSCMKELLEVHLVDMRTSDLLVMMAGARLIFCKGKQICETFVRYSQDTLVQNS